MWIMLIYADVDNSGDNQIEMSFYVVNVGDDSLNLKFEMMVNSKIIYDDESAVPENLLLSAIDTYFDVYVDDTMTDIGSVLGDDFNGAMDELYSGLRVADVSAQIGGSVWNIRIHTGTRGGSSVQASPAFLVDTYKDGQLILAYTSYFLDEKDYKKRFKTDYSNLFTDEILSLATNAIDKAFRNIGKN